MWVMFDNVDPSNGAKGAVGLITPLAQKGAIYPCKASWALEKFDSGVHDATIGASHKACPFPRSEEIISR